MSITLRFADENERKLWDDAIMESASGTIFHTWTWLRILERHTKTTLYPAMAFKGNELVALIPFFVRKDRFFKLAFSPPPGAYLLYLGPVFPSYETLKQDKKEGLYSDVLHEIDSVIFKTLGCRFARINSPPRVYDSRPFYWHDYSVSPYYTYRIPLSKGPEAVFGQFDRKLRGDIRKTMREGVVVKTGEKQDLEVIHQAISKRFAEQGYTPRNYLPYLSELYDAFSPDHFKIFLAEYQERVIGGMIALKFKDVAFLWVGVPKNTIAGISPNDLVQWEGIQWACREGCLYYEEMDSGEDSRLTSFKSKYNPELEIWYSATRYSSRIFSIGDFIRKNL